MTEVQHNDAEIIAEIQSISADEPDLLTPSIIDKSTPALSKVLKAQSRLIDDGMMHVESSQAGFMERHSRGETSHTLQVWWARRPHSAMRALTFATLCKTTSKRTLELMTSLVSSNTGDENVLAECDSILLKQYGRSPTMLDMFGGGGTIPLEGVNLGAQVNAVDINELSVFIQKCNLEYVSSAQAKALKSTIEASGLSILNRLKLRTDFLYPLRYKEITSNTRSGPITYLWTYSSECPSCNYRFFITKRPWLSKKNGRSLRFVPKNGNDGQYQTIEKIPEDKELPKAARSNQIACPKCSSTFRPPSIKLCRDEMVGFVLRKNGSGKEFVIPDCEAVPTSKVMSEYEQAVLFELQCSLPESELPKWSGIVNPSLYGIDTHADFLNPRQRIILLSLILEIKNEYQHLREVLSLNESKFVLGVLSGLVDQLVDWNCRLSMWIPQNEQVGRAFCGPGIAMLWDYAETDPLLGGPSNLFDKLKRIVQGVDALFLKRGQCQITNASARKLPFPDSYFDAIITDPPYYDNIYYNVLADFFYAWKRLLLKEIEPDLFSKDVTADSGKDELVASKIRSGTSNAAHMDYCAKLAEALDEASRVLKSDGVMSFVYTHASFGGWTALVHAFRKAKLRITSAQPLSIERKARPRAIGSVAVNTCIAFVARQYPTVKRPVRASALIKSFEEMLACGFAEGLELTGWNCEDAAMALFAQGVGLLANTSGVQGSTDEQILELFEKRIREIYPSFKLKKRSSL